MSNLLRVSDAAALALHSMVLLAARDGAQISTREIAETLSVSEAHLSKVLQRLARAGLAESIRGPKGGFVLGRDGSKITLLDVYEAIEGPLELTNCLFGVAVCGDHGCILGDLLKDVNKKVKQRLAGTKLTDVSNVYGEQHAHS